ncbi:DUF1493 family protein [Pantoea vagans]|uniref:DUF1493 family protein n=1 Tax=Pantoea vagans TaxID=470934 RepID=UPI003512ED33
MNDLSHAIITLIEYHNQPTALGGFRKVDRADFHLQQLPLNEVEFAILMNDFFATFNVCSEHYDDARYFPPAHPRHMTPMKWFTSGGYCPVTVAMLCEAASRGRWPEADY